MQLSGLRGWTGEIVDFRFPVVAIAGENGSGKSTVLKAAATAYTVPKGGQGKTALTYSPDDFFPNTPWENVTAATLAFTYQLGSVVRNGSLRKKTTRWRGMPDRPSREFYFLDIARTQPVNTLMGYGKLAQQSLASAEARKFETDTIGRLSRVLKRSYGDAEMARESGKQVGILEHRGTRYSNFHQGAGEDATLDLLALFEDVGNNSLVIIDEVDATLHPRAQRRLMTELLEIVSKKKLQVIVSTHSPYILESLPPEARIYVAQTRDGAREIIYGATAEYALSQMDDFAHTELTAYCEDTQAGDLILALLGRINPDAIPRIDIRSVGPASVVKALGEVADSNRFDTPTVAVLDGDESVSRGCIKLPGSSAPEPEVINSFDQVAWESLAVRLGTGVGELLDAVDDARAIPNHHAWVKDISRSLGGRHRPSHIWQVFVDHWANEVVKEKDAVEFVNDLTAALPEISV
ncbi:ATP-dependent nuclease [Microbacterium testaceum]|uniref:ATP-dependent nuclease n=1 Tax=Microbacterium testaceum TaxID=2033 RepID=UPI002435B76F|nr:AAA family ATPase [Microbacterium testaceum]